MKKSKNSEIYVKSIFFVVATIFFCSNNLFASKFFPQKKERHYWIAAEIVDWDYAPTKKNEIVPQKGLGVWGKDLVYKKYRYIQYSDATYSKKVQQPQHRGILGPEIRVIEGETLKIHFLNRTDRPLSMHPHGLQYDEKNEGADNKGKGAQVESGESFTYTWVADEDAAPTAEGPSSIVWLYHSHVDSVKDIADGLIGSIVVTKKGFETSKSNPFPKDIDKAFTTLFMIFDENENDFLDKKSKKYKNAEEQEEAHLKHTINGFIFGNLQGLTVKKGNRVRWHMLGMGNEVDLHTAHWHGQTVVDHHRRTDVIELLPGSMKTVDMKANTKGSWLFHCHVFDHITAGMLTRWVVRP